MGQPASSSPPQFSRRFVGLLPNSGSCPTLNHNYLMPEKKKKPNNLRWASLLFLFGHVCLFVCATNRRRVALGRGVVAFCHVFLSFSLPGGRHRSPSPPSCELLTGCYIVMYFLYLQVFSPFVGIMNLNFMTQNTSSWGELGKQSGPGSRLLRLFRWHYFRDEPG